MKNRNTPSVRQFIAKGVGVDTQDAETASALHRAKTPAEVLQAGPAPAAPRPTAG